MELADIVLQGVSQGAGAVAVLALYMDRRFLSIEAAIKDLAVAMRGAKPPTAT